MHARLKRPAVIVLLSIIGVFVLAAAALAWFLSGDGVRIALERQASAWLEHPVTIGSARAQLFPRIGIRLQNVRAGDPARITVQTVSVATGLMPLLQRRIEDAEITLTDSRIELPLPFGPSSPPAPAPDGGPPPDAGAPDTTTAESEEPAFELVSIRAITLRDIRFASRGHEVVVSAESSLAAGRVTLERVTATSERTALEASGTITLEPIVDAQLAIEADRVDVDELLALVDAFSPPGDASASAPRAAVIPAAAVDPAPAPAFRLGARVSAERATIGDLEIRQFATTLAGDGRAVSLSPLTFQIFGGRYQGSVDATLGAVLRATLRARISDLDVAQLAAYGGVADTVTGRLTGAGSFTGAGASMDAVLADVRGTGTATVTDGTVRHLNLVRTVVLFFGRPAGEAGQANDAFERLDTKFSIADGTLTADALSFTSADFDIVGRGSLRTPTKTLDGTLTMSLSEELSAQAGTDLARFTREGDRIVLPAELGGTLENPRVTIDAKAAVTRGLRNETERQLKGLLDRLGR